jgi:hypothetical protein
LEKVSVGETKSDNGKRTHEFRNEFTRTFDEKILSRNQDFVTELKRSVRRTMFVCRRCRSELSEMKRMAEFLMNKLKMFNVSLDMERRRRGRRYGKIIKTRVKTISSKERSGLN